VTTQDHTDTRITRPHVLPSVQGYAVGILDEGSFAAHNLACLLHCQRFAPHLALRAGYDTHDSRPM
jgi:hypothetical protein